MKRRFSLLLLVGALLGLLAQEAAFASAPAMPTQRMELAAAAMSDECALIAHRSALHLFTTLIGERLMNASMFATVVAVRR